MVVCYNDFDVISGFQVGIQVSEQGKQIGVVQILFEGKDLDQIVVIVNVFVQLYLNQYVVVKQVEVIKMFDFLKGEELCLKVDFECVEVVFM